MIAKSDVLILALSASALFAGIYRWQHNTQVVPAVTIPASSRVDAGAGNRPEVTREPVLESGRESGNVLSRNATGANEPAPRTGGLPDGASPDAIGTVTPRPGDDRDGAPGIAADGTDGANVVASSGDGSSYATYRVRSGDYLGLIASRFGTSVATLRELNGIDGSTILVGQELRYPRPAN